MEATLKPGLLPVLLVLHVLCGAAAGQLRTLQAAPPPPPGPKRPVLDYKTLWKALYGIWYEEIMTPDLAILLGRDVFKRGDLTTTAGRNKAIACIFQTRLEEIFDPPNSGPRRYKWSVFVDEHIVPEAEQAVYGVAGTHFQSMHVETLDHKLDSNPAANSVMFFYPGTQTQGVRMNRKMVAMLITPFGAPHWSTATSANFNRAVAQTTRRHDQLPLDMRSFAEDLFKNFKELEGQPPTAAIACPKGTCGYWAAEGHLLLHPNAYLQPPVCVAPAVGQPSCAIRPRVIAAVLPGPVR